MLRGCQAIQVQVDHVRELGPRSHFDLKVSRGTKASIIFHHHSLRRIVVFSHHIWQQFSFRDDQLSKVDCLRRRLSFGLPTSCALFALFALFFISKLTFICLLPVTLTLTINYFTLYRILNLQICKDMSAADPQRTPGWYWPDDVPKADPQPQSSATSGESSGAQHQSQSSQPRQRRRKNWPPRQCRICLETVNPTTHMPSESIPGLFRSEPNVTYEDESGRLIRPCMCKGSSKYVHEGCLQAWRHADPSYGRRNYWQCPTCGYKYRLARMGMGRWVASTGQ